MELDFRPASEDPTTPGDYLLFNQCDGYHIVEAWFTDGEFDGFWFFASSKPVSKDFYRAWALLPPTNTMFSKFGEEVSHPKEGA